MATVRPAAVMDMGTTTIGSTSYRVYNHSTTNAQVLTTLTASTESATVAFTSMTKDSGLTGTGANTDWRTADGTAGRLVSGTLATALASGSVVKVYANGTLLGNATVNAAGTAWEYTDTAGYSANWTYTAKVVDGSGNAGPVATQAVTTDLLAAAPVINGVTDSASVARMVQACVQRFGRIDILINNVGRSEPGGPVEMPEEVWDEQMDINVKTAYLCMKHVLPVMEQQGSGSVVSISSVAGLRYVGKPQVGYAAAKAAMMQLTKTTAVLVELGIAPGDAVDGGARVHPRALDFGRWAPAASLPAAVGWREGDCPRASALSAPALAAELVPDLVRVARADDAALALARVRPR